MTPSPSSRIQITAASAAHATARATSSVDLPLPAVAPDGTHTARALSRACQRWDRELAAISEATRTHWSQIAAFHSSVAGADVDLAGDLGA